MIELDVVYVGDELKFSRDILTAQSETEEREFP